MKMKVLILFMAVSLALPATAWYPGPYGAAHPYAGATPPGGFGYQEPRRIRVETLQTADGYVARVNLQGYRPSDIEVKVEGRHLLIHSARSEQREERMDGGYRFARSSQRFFKRLPLPGDAQPDAMQRTDGDGYVEVLIPRRR